MQTYVSRTLATLLASLALITAACGGPAVPSTSSAEDKVIALIASDSGFQPEIVALLKEEVAKQGYELKHMVINDIVQPNQLVEDKQADANFFQHEAYMNQFNLDHKTHVVPAFYTTFAPSGFFSRKFRSFSDVPDGALFGIPADPANNGRALFILRDAGLLKMKDLPVTKASTRDITDNPHKFRFIEVDQLMLQRTLDDVDVGFLFPSKYFKVLGPHLSEPSPQRTPVLYQAGTSGRGKTFAARHAEAIFLGGSSLEAVKSNIDDIRRLAADLGRDPHHIKMFPSLQVIVGRTKREAEAKRDEIQKHLSIEGLLAHYAGSSGFDLSAYDPDDILEYQDTDHGQTAARRFTDGPKRTVRQVIEEMGRLGDRTLFFVCGTPEEVADKMQYWMEETGLDGYNLSQHLTPRTFKDFIDLVVPELQRRGLYRTSYEPGTYRERLLGPGIARLPDDHPASSYRRRVGAPA